MHVPYGDFAPIKIYELQVGGDFDHKSRSARSGFVGPKILKPKVISRIISIFR